MADQEQRLKYGENRSLFSDYFLSERLDQKKEWKEDISAPFQRILQIYYEKKEALPSYNEAQTEKEFIQPILEEVLGFQYDVQHTEKYRGKINTPDYICFSDSASLLKAQKNRGESVYYANALAIAEAKYWMRSLDEKGVSEKDLQTNVNPSFQIVNYLTVTGLEWGILTNGSKWRLYSSKGRSRIDSYFEVDLKQILEEEDEEQFRYFYLFFRKNAFLPDPQTGTSFLESVVEGSIEYGSRLEKKLKDLIFEDIFLDLGRGFVEYRGEEAIISEETEESLQDLYKGTLRLLYRLLFLLHAESRGLLPLDNKGYKRISLRNLRYEVAERIDEDIPQGKHSFDLWNDVDSLCNVIDKGEAGFNVPRYNGGLFRRDHPNNRFLADHKISDYYLVPVLEKLTREIDPETGQKRFIDYKSLNVEQLGSIYEGLLEFHLRIADEKLAVVKEKGREVYKPEKDVKNPIKVLQKGELYLENDKGERKATGSYYTPHYIVEYIVENTLGPVFEERAATFREIMEKLAPKYEAFTKLDEKIREGDRADATHIKRKGLNEDIKILENRAVETLLSIKICDPAMGSGHFLKEATDKLAEKIIVLVGEFQENPVSRMLEDVRTQILDSLEKQNISIDAEEHLRDTNLIKRMVMKRCIYGVDLNPMAVELAKLSLWLDSFTVGAPLSFLDHHLRAGNSLIGTTVNEVKFTLEIDEDSQIDIFGGPFAGLLTATELMRNVALKTDATIVEIEESIEQFSEYEKAVLPYKKLLDLWLSQHFDNDKAIMLLRQYPEKIIAKYKDQKTDLKKQYEPILEVADERAQEEHFFHWELEFPEVFVDLRKTKWLENPGFDVVIGNPPYGTVEKEIDKFLRSNFEVSSYFLDLFHLFIEKGVLISKKKGKFGQIVPEPWLTMENTQNLREFILSETQISQIVQFSKLVFEDATVDSIIIIMNRVKPKKSSNFDVFIAENQKNGIASRIQKNTIEQEELKQFPHSRIEIRLTSTEQKLYNKVQDVSVPLSKCTNISIGIQAYNSSKHTKEQIENRVFHSDQKVDENYFPELNGNDVSRYSLSPKKDAWIKYGSHLHDYRPFEYFSEPRILVREITGGKNYKIHAVYTDEVYCNYKTILNILQKDTKASLFFILAILNSKLMSWVFPLSSNKLVSDTFPRISVSDLKSLPLRKIDFSQFNPEKNKEYPDQLKELFQSYLTDSTTEDLLELTNQLINDEEEYRLPLIHNFLAFLAEKMLKYNTEMQRLNSALDPFKFLNKGTAFKPFKTVFAESIKYGQLLNDEIDLGKVHHDIEGLRLEPVNPSDRSKRSDGSEWQLSLLLKHRDPATDWEDWQKDEDDNIVRSTQPVYQFDLSDEQGRYWQQSFEVLDQFENRSNFPGGKTRTTHEKLMESDVPVFDEKANIEPLIELREELAETQEKIEKTDWLIDQVVYRLYGLSEEEIEVVEGSV